jgi:hypothetical protein
MKDGVQRQIGNNGYTATGDQVTPQKRNKAKYFSKCAPQL